MSTLIPSMILAAPLGTDSAAMCTGFGARGRMSLRRRLVISGTLTAFEALMPVVGIMLAGVVGESLGESARWIGGALLVLLGVHMMRADDGETGPAPIGAGALLLAGLAVSVDEIAVGVSLGLGSVNVPVLVGTIGTIVFAATMAGLTLGALVARHADVAGKLAAWALVGLGILLAVGIL
jgi:putative Mn2+ efflux pump MntP